MKRGQVTIFIILGIVVVVLGFLAISYKDVVITELQRAQLFQTQELPDEVEEVKGFVEGCLQLSLEEGIRQLALRGGYLTTPEDEIPTTFANPFSNRLAIFPNSDLEVPYWFYETANGVDKQQMPTLQTMQEDLAAYVERNIGTCIANFQAFPSLSLAVGLPSINTKINMRDVEATMVYPIVVETKGQSFSLVTFGQEVKSGLGTIYESAKKIHENENKDLFLEEKTLDFLVTYDQIPYSGVDFDCTPRTWVKQEVIKDFKNILAVNIPTLKVGGTRFRLPEGSSDYLIATSLSQEEELSVNFLYSQDWPTIIEITPNGEILRGDSLTESKAGRFITSLFCLNSYHFIYDIKYPVIVSLSDGDLIFQFATQVIVDNNQPRENQVLVNQVPAATSTICERKIMPLEVFLGTETVQGAEPVEGARITMNCLGVSCDLGMTGSDGQLITNAPQCLNGFVEARKEGLKEVKEQIISVDKASLSLRTEKIYEIPFDVRLISPSGIRQPSTEEKVVFTLENADERYTETIVYPEKTTVKLIPGDYQVSSFVLTNATQAISLKDKTLETCVDIPKKGIGTLLGLTERKCEEITLEASPFNDILVGGSSFTWQVSLESLEGANRITFFALRKQNPQDLAELTEIYQQIQEPQKRGEFRFPLIE